MDPRSSKQRMLNYPSMQALEEGPRQRRRIECPKGAQLPKAASMTSALEASLPYLLKRQKRQLSLPLHSFYAVLSAKGMDLRSPPRPMGYVLMKH